MTKYHRLASKIDRGYGKLAAAAKGFIAHVKVCLPARKERWWLTVFDDIDSEKVARKQLREALMFEAEPLSVAFECAQKMENEANGLLKAKEKLEARIDLLEFRENQTLKRREEYKNLLVQEDQVRRDGVWDWYEMVRDIRNIVSRVELGPYIQINQLQASLQEEIEIETGFPELEADSLGKGAMHGLFTQNRKIDWRDNLDEVLPSEDDIVEDLIWSLYLSCASGETVPGGVVETQRPEGTKTCRGTHVLRN